MLKQRMIDYFIVIDIVEEICPRLSLYSRPLRTLPNPRFHNFNHFMVCMKSHMGSVCVCVCYRREPEKLTFGYLYFRVLHDILLCQKCKESKEQALLRSSVRTDDCESIKSDNDLEKDVFLIISDI